MNSALLSLALAIFTQAFPDTVSTEWSIESAKSTCEPDGGECTMWVVGTHDGTRYRCADVNTYVAACWTWENERWNLLFD